MRKIFALIAIGLAAPVLAKDVPWNVVNPNQPRPAAPGGVVDEPWFTGPLLAPSAHIVPGGHINYEPYLYATAVRGSYDGHWNEEDAPLNWNIVFQHPLQIGITSWMDFEVTPSWTWNIAQHAQNFVLNDLPFGLEFQLLSDSLTNYWPAMKINLHATIPSGPYDDLALNQEGTDAGGGGAYVAGAGLSFSRLIRFSPIYWANLRLAFQYNFSTRVHVHGKNAYGGGLGTDGIVYPGQTYGFDFGLEFSISRHWGLALDVVGAYQTATHFKGKSGVTAAGAPAVLSADSSAQYSLAPAIEYNWNSNIGIITGGWFTFTGRNSQAFASWVSAFNYFY